jgi:FtsP/CotA-like multicopper oxidase with cupredoxin domain
MTGVWSAALCLFALFASMPAARVVRPNDNTRPAGRLNGAELTLRLVADVGTWRPSGLAGAAVDVAAFGEDGGELSVPGPLVRVREGTAVMLTLRNALSRDLTVHGLCSRPGTCAPVAIPAGTTREVRFTLTTPGTYHYWGTSSAPPLAARSREDTQLGGAIVVDPRAGSPPDRVLVVSILEHPASAIGAVLQTPADSVFAINGVTWPHTERLRYQTGDAVRWRVINLSGDQHAMHLHGFHFTVEAAGDGLVDRPLAADQQRTGVTEFLRSGQMIALAWTPTRPGNWLFHCHMVVHMTPASEAAHAGHGAADGAAGMAGLVVGVEVTGPDAAAATSPARAPRRFALALSEEPNRYGTRPGFRMDVEGGGAPRLDPGPVPGPVLVVERGAPVEITLKNKMRDATAIHWHGIELDSYFDGVPGFGGRLGSITPPVEPGGSFVARFTPPRAGTFIYHTHWHDEAQLAGGLYGALIVLEPGERYDPAVDHVVIIGLNGVLVPGGREPFALNGRREDLAPIRMRVGAPNRLRLINITPNNVAITAQLVDQFEAAQWTPLAKDGAALPAGQTAPRLARQLVSVGETYDFIVQSATPKALWLEVRRGNGEWVLQTRVDIR